MGCSRELRGERVGRCGEVEELDGREREGEVTTDSER